MKEKPYANCWSAIWHDDPADRFDAPRHGRSQGRWWCFRWRSDGKPSWRNGCRTPGKRGCFICNQRHDGKSGQPASALRPWRWNYFRRPGAHLFFWTGRVSGRWRYSLANGSQPTRRQTGTWRYRSRHSRRQYPLPKDPTYSTWKHPQPLQRLSSWHGLHEIGGRDRQAPSIKNPRRRSPDF